MVGILYKVIVYYRELFDSRLIFSIQNFVLGESKFGFDVTLNDLLHADTIEEDFDEKRKKGNELNESM